MNKYNMLNSLLYYPIQEGFGEKVILIESEQAVTYNQLGQMVAKILDYLETALTLFSFKFLLPVSHGFMRHQIKYHYQTNKRRPTKPEPIGKITIIV